jgi:hypothetical protein
MLRAAGIALLLVGALCGCDVVSFVTEGLAWSNEAAAALEKQIGTKPQVSFNYKNGVLTAVTVQFRSVPPVDLAGLERVSRAAVAQAFKREPNELVVAFVFEKKS